MNEVNWIDGRCVSCFGVGCFIQYQWIYSIHWRKEGYVLGQQASHPKPHQSNLFFSISSCSMNLLFSLLFEKWAVGEVKEEERRAPGAKTYNQLSRNLKFFEFQWREQAKTTFLPFHFTKKRKDNSTNWSFLYLFYFSEEKKSFVFFSLLN